MCAGRAFDFSDHVVLYYAQILPIALIETLYAFQNPYWSFSDDQHIHDRAGFGAILRRRIPPLVLPTLLVGSHLYLQFITATAAYKTAAFFHTPAEVVAGFGVSSIVTLPLLFAQCSSSSWAVSVRFFLFRY
jgi:hypothetical protein